MSLHSIKSVTLGVPDPATTGSFLEGFGLEPLGGSVFATGDGGAQLELEPASPRCLKQLVLAADEESDVDRVAEHLRAAGSEVSACGLGISVREPATGIEVVVQPGSRQAPSGGMTGAEETNRPGSVARWDRPAQAVLEDDAPVRVSNLTHLALSTPDLPTSLGFFCDLLGFEVSDAVSGVVAFTRVGELHHTLALQQGEGTLLHHLAFEVRGVDDVVRGGSRMVETHPGCHVWGPGRHAIGSNWFWYLREPGGNYLEYTADIDRISSQEAYVPKAWGPSEILYSAAVPPPPEFLEPVDASEVIAAGRAAGCASRPDAGRISPPS